MRTAGPQAKLAVPEGAYTAHVEFSGKLRNGRPFTARAARQIKIEDFLIVSIGDSYASGEGNPERINAGTCRQVMWADTGRPGEWTFVRPPGRRSGHCAATRPPPVDVVVGP